MQGTSTQNSSWRRLRNQAHVQAWLKPAAFKMAFRNNELSLRHVEAA